VARSKRAVLAGLLPLALCLGCEWAEREPAAAGELPAETAAGEIALDAEQARGIATTSAEVSEARVEDRAFGRVLDPVPLLEASGALTAAEAVARARARDLERTRALAKDQENASAHDVAAAEVADAEARGALAQAEARARAVWGTSDASALARLSGPLARGELAVARIELSSALPSGPVEIRVSAPALGLGERPAEAIGSAGALDATLQAPALLVAIRGSPPPSGAALEAVVAQGEAIHGVWLPASAIVWSEGQPLIFVATGGDHFEKRSVALARPLREGYLATSGVSPGDRVVRTGAQQLLSSLVVRNSPEEADED
jgi:hypothetical protein